VSSSHTRLAGASISIWVYSCFIGSNSSYRFNDPFAFTFSGTAIDNPPYTIHSPNGVEGAFSDVAEVVHPGGPCVPSPLPHRLHDLTVAPDAEMCARSASWVPNPRYAWIVPTLLILVNSDELWMSLEDPIAYLPFFEPSGWKEYFVRSSRRTRAAGIM
jgi:hypothetical protein